MAFDSVNDAVEYIAAELAKIEEFAGEIPSLNEAFAAITVETDLGTLESLALASEFTALIAQFRADLWNYHARLTERAKSLEIDIPARDGGR